MDTSSGDVKTGAAIILKALEEPLKQIAANAGLEGSVIVDRVKNSKPDIGFDVLSQDYVNMIEKGIVDPTKVARTALQNAASIAAMVLPPRVSSAKFPNRNPRRCQAVCPEAVCINRNR